MSHKLSEKILLLNYFEKTSDQRTVMTKLNPTSKVLVTILYLVILMSFPKYEILGTAGMVLYPSVLFAVEGISLKRVVKSTGPVIAVLLLFGCVNILIDRTMISAGILGTIPGGIASCITLSLKGTLAVTASFVLVATTKIDEICYGLQRIRVPKVICIQILLMFRYLSVILNEAEAMNEAYHLRAPGQRGINKKAWGSFLGQLLIRSLEKAEIIYESMMLRGFKGEFKTGTRQKMKKNEIAYFLFWLGVFLVLRTISFAEWIGMVISKV